MAWEPRGPSGRRYYYKKVRTADGHVRSVYVGAGPFAKAVAELDALARDMREAERAADRALADDVGAADRAARAATAAVGAALSAALESRGLRYHRGEWRRPRPAGTAPGGR